MIRAGIVGLTVLAVASGLATSTFALDSTSRQRIDTFGWQPPNARMLNNKTESQLDVNSSATSAYATTANSSSYATSAGTATTATTASTVPVENISGIPSCSSNYVLMKSGATLTCVNRTALANDLYGAPSCSSGQALSRNSSGTYSCVSASGGGGGSTFTCSGGTNAAGEPYSGPTVGAYGWANIWSQRCQCTASNTWGNCSWL